LFDLGGDVEEILIGILLGKSQKLKIPPLLPAEGCAQCGYLLVELAPVVQASGRGKFL